MPKRKVLPIKELFKFTPEDLKDNLHTNLDILFEDGVVLHLSYREIILTRFLMEVYNVVPNVKIVSSHCITNYYTNGFLTSKTINKAFERIVEDVVNVYCKPNNDRSILDIVYHQMQLVFNHIYNKLSYDKQSYCNSININDLLDIQMVPELIEAIKNVDRKKDVNSVNHTYRVLDNIIRKDQRFKDNVVAKGYISGSINANQVKQLLASRGYVTEINSAIFKIPVASSFTLGMGSIYDLAIESRSGAKALDMSHSAIQNSEYFAREMQLITMIVDKLEDGDCGSTEYLDWYVRPKTDTTKPDLPNLLGKYYLNEETGQEEVITSKHTHLEGKTIKLRSAINCKLKNKNAVCSKCFGELAYGIPKHFNIGHYCTTVMTQKLTQSILSTKHLTSSASSGDIHLDPIAVPFFTVKNNNYYFKPNVLTPKHHWELIINQFEAFGLKDLKSNVDVYKLNPGRVSRIQSITLRSVNIKTNEVKTYPIIIRDINKFGSFTYEFINHIASTGASLDDNDNYIINLDEFNPKLPFIVMPEIEYNFELLVKNIKSQVRGIEMIKGEGSKETPESFLQILFDIVNTKLDINIALFEIIVYAFTVASVKRRDYRLSRNSSDRTLMRSRDIIPLRSLGVGYGWEKVLDTMLLSPKCYYGYNNVNHPMDVVIKPHRVLNGDKRYTISI